MPAIWVGIGVTGFGGCRCGLASSFAAVSFFGFRLLGVVLCYQKPLLTKKCIAV